MPVIFLPNGLGENAGDPLAVASPLLVNGDVWYVDSATGSDAASPRGKNRSRPLATLAQAQTNGANGDIIVLMDGHAETLTAALTISKSLTIVGAGKSSGLPTVKFTNNSAAASLFTVTATYFQLRNVWINAQAQSNSAIKVTCTSTWAHLSNIYMECNGYDTAAGLAFTGAGYRSVESSTFISTATAASAQPALAMGAAGTTLWLRGVVFDGGTVGFSNYHAFETTAALTYLFAEGISLLRGVDMKVLEATAGYINPQVSTRDARVDWCDI